MHTRKLHAFAALAALLVAGPARAGTIQYLAPGYFPNGIDGANIVGTAGSSGFLYNGSTYTTFAYPGAVRTIAYAVSGNKIVGDYMDSHSQFHPFLYDGTTWTALISPPGAKLLTVTGISSNNIVGAYVDSNSKSHGVIISGSTYTTLDNPLGAFGTGLYHISDNSIVGGYYDSTTASRAFLYDGSVWTTLTAPGATFTEADGVSGANVVGTAQFTSSSVGYLYNSSGFTYPLSYGDFPSFPFQSVSSWRFSDISGNKIIGTVTYANLNGTGTYSNYGFIYTIPEPSSLLLASFGTAGAFLLARRCRGRDSPR